ncbi:MAG: NIL domain-containing protein [Candidatus Omnitrophota bacterium]
MQVAVGLTFPGTLKDEGVICFLCKKFNVNINIVEASFSTASGWAIIGIEGEESEINKVFQHLKNRDISINKVGETK